MRLMVFLLGMVSAWGLVELVGMGLLLPSSPMPSPTPSAVFLPVRLEDQGLKADFGHEVLLCRLPNIKEPVAVPLPKGLRATVRVTSAQATQRFVHEPNTALGLRLVRPDTSAAEGWRDLAVHEGENWLLLRLHQPTLWHKQKLIENASHICQAN